MRKKPKVHFVHNSLINPTNPVTVILVGCGGTGSQVLTNLAKINHALLALNHAGIHVKVFDDDTVTHANLGRQLFADAETGLNKAVALVNRINRFFGTNWKAIPCSYSADSIGAMRDYMSANIIISCVDTVAARYEIADIIRMFYRENGYQRDRILYWMDYGNGLDSGQVILSTAGKIKQPVSKKFKPVDSLPFITDEFKRLLDSAKDDTTPSCSLAEALTKQDLFINPSLANFGCSLLFRMFREGMITERGAFVNLRAYRTQGLSIAA